MVRSIAFSSFKYLLYSSLGHTGLAIPKLEPLHINEININQGANSPINIDLKFSNLDLFGISKAMINQVM